MKTIVEKNQPNPTDGLCILLQADDTMSLVYALSVKSSQESMIVA